MQGIARTVLVVPRLGKEAAIKLDALTGSALAFVICLFLVPPMGLRAPAHLLALGLFLAVFMAGFDVAVEGLADAQGLAQDLAQLQPAGMAGKLAR